MKQHKKVGVFIARFQPLNYAHKAIIDTMIEECDEVCVYIGSPNRLPNPSNPWEVNVRRDMLDDVYGDSIHIDTMNDTPDDEAWEARLYDELRYLEDKYETQYVVLYGGEGHGLPASLPVNVVCGDAKNRNIIDHIDESLYPKYEAYEYDEQFTHPYTAELTSYPVLIQQDIDHNHRVLAIRDKFGRYSLPYVLPCLDMYRGGYTEELVDCLHDHGMTLDQVQFSCPVENVIVDKWENKDDHGMKMATMFVVPIAYNLQDNGDAVFLDLHDVMSEKILLQGIGNYVVQLLWTKLRNRR